MTRRASERAPAALRRYAIITDADRFFLPGQARRLARALGLDARGQASLGIVVAELVTNVLKFAGRGELELEPLGPPSPGLRVLVRDEGPGVPDVVLSMRDGYSEGRMLTPDVPMSARRGLGTGLGAVLRLMDDVQIDSRPGCGTRVVAVRWLASRR